MPRHASARVPLLRLAVLCLVLSGCAETQAAEDSRSAKGTSVPGPIATESASLETPPVSGGLPRSADRLNPTSSPAPRERRPGATVIVARSAFGSMLFSGDGQPLYLFTAEDGPRPSCFDACAVDWPPLLTEGAPQASRGARAALLGTTRRPDGRLQVTYDGHPLYTYAHEGPYQVLCHDVVEYGGTWFVVRPDGTPAPG